MHVREPEITSLKTEGELGVLHPQQMKDRGVDVVNVRLVLDDIESEFVRFSNDLARRYRDDAAY